MSCVAKKKLWVITIGVAAILLAVCVERTRTLRQRNVVMHAGSNSPEPRGGSQLDSITIRVFDPAGQLLPEAVIMQVDADTGLSYGEGGSQLEGFKLRPLHDRHNVLIAVADGFPPKFVALSDPPAPSLDIRLEVSRTVELELVNSDGSPHLQTPRISADLFGQAVQTTTRMSDNKYTVEGLPKGEVELNIAERAWNTTIVISAEASFVRLTCGQAGRITMELTVSEHQHSNQWRAAIAAPNSTIDLYRAQLFPMANGTHFEAQIAGIPFGNYDVWLESFGMNGECKWVRTGVAECRLITAADPMCTLWRAL